MATALVLVGVVVAFVLVTAGHPMAAVAAIVGFALGACFQEAYKQEVGTDT